MAMQGPQQPDVSPLMEAIEESLEALVREGEATHNPKTLLEFQERLQRILRTFASSSDPSNAVWQCQCSRAEGAARFLNLVIPKMTPGDASLAFRILSTRPDVFVELMSALRELSLNDQLKDFLKEADPGLIRTEALIEALSGDLSGNDPSGLLINEVAQTLESLKNCSAKSIRRFRLAVPSTGEWMEFVLQQSSYQETNVAWRAWDAGILLAKWICENEGMFRGKRVLELGSGCCGITGLAAACFTKELILSDLRDPPAILQLLKDNLQRNQKVSLPTASSKATPKRATGAAASGEAYRHCLLPTDSNSVRVVGVDWTEDLRKNPSTANLSMLQGNADLIIGTDIFYDDKLVEALANTVNNCLSRKPKACFLGISAKKRLGVTKFRDAMEKRGFVLLPSSERLTPPSTASEVASSLFTFSHLNDFINTSAPASSGGSDGGSAYLVPLYENSSRPETLAPQPRNFIFYRFERIEQQRKK